MAHNRPQRLSEIAGRNAWPDAPEPHGTRVQGLADSRAIFATKSVVENPQMSKMLEANKLKLTEQNAALRGVADRMTVYQIP
jgi:hypothetical protein